MIVGWLISVASLAFEPDGWSLEGGAFELYYTLSDLCSVFTVL